MYDIEDGKMKLAIETTKSLYSNPLGKRSQPWGVAVYQSNYIVTDWTYFPTVYDSVTGLQFYIIVIKI